MFIPRGSIRHELSGDLWNSFYSLLNPNTLKKVNDKTRKKTSEAINKEFDQYKSHLLPYARTCFLTIIKALNISKGSEVLMTPINIYPILNVIESLELKVKFIILNISISLKVVKIAAVFCADLSLFDIVCRNLDI